MSVRQKIQLRETVTGDDPSVAPTATLIVLHGLGSDGQDFAPLVKELDLSSAGPVRFVFPNAPLRTVSIGDGEPVRAWYDPRPVAAESGAVSTQDEEGLRASCEVVQALIDREAARGMPPGHVVLLGFSQGAVLTLMAGLRAPQRLAGLVVLSGYLPLSIATEAEASAANRDVPIFMAHGRQDPVVSPQRAESSRDKLLRMGYDIAWHDYPMGHEISPKELHDLNGWLSALLAPWH
ncbi:alpha/beta hydrolase [Hydrogenophaga pseudoflava]|uniref:alpha/beta hydrolase n=1 Tax=Hydrogenophaga pseudoflava TaxID=47421 RepID=UPI0027E4556E|nr:alpha/beta fold hydrolase [Hydrogenophaga pseudoflava]MDQ7744748.1 alpha/beta fold hydrolase [Hydrogenophaga pseudoflava]